MNTGNTYVIYYHGSGKAPLETNATSLYAAKQAGIAFFKPPRSKQHQITPYLVEKDGEQVTTVITS